MKKILLIIKREFLSRVKKKSFLLATILIPLIFPAVIGGMIYIRVQSEENKKQETIRIFDESDNLLIFEDSKEYTFEKVEGPLDSAKAKFVRSEDFALIYIPSFDVSDPKGFMFFTKSSPGITLIRDFERGIETQIRDIKLTRSGLTQDQLDELKSNVAFESFNLTETGDETKSDANSTFWLGYVMGFLIYIFLFAYGAQVMQGVIEEKSSKIVEVIVSTVRPYHMMIGKVVGVASVGVFQFVIWIVLMFSISTIGISVMGANMLDPTESAALMVDSGDAQELIETQNQEAQKIIAMVQDIPVLKIMLLFLFYFLGGYLMYGALFAAVGSAVDTPADAQQFMMPIMLPIIVALMSLFMFVFEDPNGPVSTWLSLIPFTSPIVMMGRIGFGVPTWEIIVSMICLILGFLFTLWLAGRIYRIGILMHGAKVNYKVLGKWLMMKN